MSDLNESKPWQCSRTIWFNVVIAMLTVLCTGIDLLRSALSPEWYLAVSMVAAGVNVWLRTKTALPIGGKK